MNIWTITAKELLNTLHQPLKSLKGTATTFANQNQQEDLTQNTQFVRLHISRIIITAYALIPIEISNLIVDMLTNPHQEYKMIYNMASGLLMVVSIVYIYLCGRYLQGRFAHWKTPWKIYRSFWYLVSMFLLLFITADLLERQAFNNVFLLYIIITIIPILSGKHGIFLYLFNIVATTTIAITVGMPQFLIQQLIAIGLAAYVLSRYMSNTVIRNFLLQQRLEKMNQTLKRLSVTDPLTGLYNRRKADEHLEQIWNERNIQDTIALMAFDVDHFKDYNDTYGHLAGDECLVQIAQILSSSIEEIKDAEVYRTGGEEFLIITKRQNEKQVLSLAKQIRRKVERLSLSAAEQPTQPTTISIGIADHTPDESDKEDIYQQLWRRADAALYKAKEAGRNRIAFGDLLTQ